ncbi:MAG: putative zinc-binding protein [candidate division WOR-3 bacterium]
MSEPIKKSHEAIIFACFGGLSNTGIITGLASMEAVKELGLKKAGIGCLPSVPINNPTIFEKVKMAKKVITVDGCPFECSRKVVEAGGIKIARSIVLTRDIQMIKRSLARDLDGNPLPLMDYIDPEDVKKVKQAIIRAVTGED